MVEEINDINVCIFCNVSEDKVRLFEAVGNEGIILVCEKCAFDEHIPLIRKPTTFQLREAERPSRRAREEILKARDPKEIKRKQEERRKYEEKRRQDITLKEIIDRNYEKKIQNVSNKPRVPLIDNFHWVIMRARRNKKISQAQLAEAIFESEVAIKMAEIGKMPEGDFRLVNKLENFLGIKIKKDLKEKDEYFEGERDELLRKKEKQPLRDLGFKRDIIENITIADLKEMRKNLSSNRNLELLKKAEEEALEEEYEELSKKSKKKQVSKDEDFEEDDDEKER